MTVSDIMTKEVISIQKETQLAEAAGILAKFRIHGLPVVDEEKKVLGIITESDFFTKDSSNIYLPTFLDFIRNGDIDNPRSSDSQEIEKKSKIKDIMTEGCLTVRPETEIEKLIAIFKEKNFNSVPVTDEQGVLVGIVTVMDIIRLL
jgi:CBS domain-containing membrane protein